MPQEEKFTKAEVAEAIERSLIAHFGGPLVTDYEPHTVSCISTAIMGALRKPYEPVPADELKAIMASTGVGIPKEAIVASQRFLAEKLLEAQQQYVPKPSFKVDKVTVTQVPEEPAWSGPPRWRIIVEPKDALDLLTNDPRKVLSPKRFFTMKILRDGEVVLEVTDGKLTVGSRVQEVNQLLIDVDRVSELEAQLAEMENQLDVLRRAQEVRLGGRE